MTLIHNPGLMSAEALVRLGDIMAQEQRLDAAVERLRQAEQAVKYGGHRSENLHVQSCRQAVAEAEKHLTRLQQSFGRGMAFGPRATPEPKPPVNSPARQRTQALLDEIERGEELKQREAPDVMRREAAEKLKADRARTRREGARSGGIERRPGGVFRKNRRSDNSGLSLEQVLVEMTAQIRELRSLGITRDQLRQRLSGRTPATVDLLLALWDTE